MSFRSGGGGEIPRRKNNFLKSWDLPAILVKKFNNQLSLKMWQSTHQNTIDTSPKLSVKYYRYILHNISLKIITRRKIYLLSSRILLSWDVLSAGSDHRNMWISYSRSVPDPQLRSSNPCSRYNLRIYTENITFGINTASAHGSSRLVISPKVGERWREKTSSLEKKHEKTRLITKSPPSSGKLGQNFQ